MPAWRGEAPWAADLLSLSQPVDLGSEVDSTEIKTRVVSVAVDIKQETSVDFASLLSSGVFTILCDCSLICLCSSVSPCMESSGVKCSSMRFAVSSKLDVSVASSFWSVVSCVCRFLLAAANL